MMKLTTQQEDLITEAVYGKHSFIGIARAGTGKTCTAALAAKAYMEANPGETVLGMAFNRIIVKSLIQAIPEGVIKTANGFGFGAWMGRSGKTIKKVNQYKTKDIIKELGGDETFSDLAKAVMLCKAWGLVPSGTPAEPESFMPDEPESYRFLFDQYNVNTEECEDPIGLVREVLSRSITRGWRGDIDFDDQIYLPTIYHANFRKENFLIIDETQDLNPIQRYMAIQMLKPDGRLFALGDDCQAIYGFRGADRESMTRIIEEFSCKIMRLTVSFRCPRSVVQCAQQFVPDIEPFAGAIEGSVSEATPSYKLVPVLKNSRDVKTAILCRNNAPLVACALNLIRSNIGAIILGRDLEKGLIYMIDRQKASSLQELNSKLWNFIKAQADILVLRGASAQADLLEDKGKCLEILILNEIAGSDTTIHGLKRRIRSLFDDKQKDKPVVLSTIHKAKGLEWPQVFILDKALMPSKYAKTSAEIQQENNLHYVAITRSQRSLTYITSENII